MFDNFDPDSPLIWLLRLVLEVLRWIRLAITLRRRPGGAPADGKGGDRS
jgi:hypothetical protein